MEDAVEHTELQGLHLERDDEKQLRLYLAGAGHTEPLVIEHLDPWPVSTHHLQDPERSSQIRLHQIKDWISNCDQGHGPYCSQHYVRQQQDSDILLIDVKRRCIVKASSNSTYVALSYVWGGVGQLLTTRSNFSRLLCGGAFDVGDDYYDDLPQVIKDATSLVEGLGQRYLWVDCLCIVQDDRAAKHRQILHMANIYNGALFTIVALAGEDANAGLPGVRAGTRPLPRQKLDPEREGARLGLTGLSIRTRRISTSIKESKYNSRAWTFQERLLSRRCLFILPDRVVFQCRKSIRSENTYDDTTCDPATLNPLNQLPEWRLCIADNAWRAAFRFYVNLVMEYMKKEMTERSDVINAFSGIMTVLESHSDWWFVSGLPNCLLDFALLWTPSGVARRRAPAGSGAKSQYPSHDTFPSWSWSGWEGAIDYDQMWMHSSVSNGCLRSCIDTIRLRTRSDVENVRPINRGPTEIHVNRSGKSSSKRIAKQAQACNMSPRDIRMSRRPPLGTVLEFFAHAVPITEFQFVSHPHRQDPPSNYEGDPQTIFQILDVHNRCCGLLYGVNPQDLRNLEESDKIILLSELDDYESEYRTGDDWYGVDRHHYPRKYSCILNIMLTRKTRTNYFERVAIGRIHADAWDGAFGGRVDFIQLA